MNKRICIVGGSSGLGSVVSQKLIEGGGVEIVYVSRNVSSDPRLEEATHISLDLATCSALEVNNFLICQGPFDAFCFCQRYRSSDISVESAFIEEYRVTVYSILLIIDSYFKIYTPTTQLSAVVVGSTYASCVGFDQPPGYHCAKAAQKSLVKSLSNLYRALMSINMFSPPTFIKEGADLYWAKSSKTSLWETFPGARLPSVDAIADAIILSLLNPNQFCSGNDIILDSGFSHVYFDQVSYRRS